MHGVAGSLALGRLRAAGYDDVHVVAEQAEPDPAFPTLPFPNPEEDGALDLVEALGDEVGADLILANDPDGDQLGVAVPGGDGWRALTGNEIGALLADHLLPRATIRIACVVTTIVSFAARSGRRRTAAGVHREETLTGFKWIVRPAIAHPHWRFVFGFEEALGYLVDTPIRDKDGITTALAMAGLAEARGRGAA